MPAYAPLSQRFWPKVDRSAGCWLWKGYLRRDGYGTIRGERGGVVYAHRVAYELTRGPIPDGLTLDHLCRTPACVNPWHLEPVTQGVNAKRVPPRIRCPHDRTEATLVRHKDGGIAYCKLCRNEQRRAHYYADPAWRRALLDKQADAYYRTPRPRRSRRVDVGGGAVVGRHRSADDVRLVVDAHATV